MNDLKGENQHITHMFIVTSTILLVGTENKASYKLKYYFDVWIFAKFDFSPVR